MSVDGALLDRIETVLRERHQKRRTRDDWDADAQAITSGQLADDLGIDDSEGNPKTREAIKVLKRERGLPVVAGNTGYYIPVERGPIEDYIESLEGRIDGIRENQQLMRENWQAWQQHAEAELATDGGEDLELTEEERERIENDPVLTIKDVRELRGGDE